MADGLGNKDVHGDQRLLSSTYSIKFLLPNSFGFTVTIALEGKLFLFL
jgi:hypothetical protein